MLEKDFRELRAHTPRKGTEEWHLLVPHLMAVAARAARNAQYFDSEREAFLAGLWHDLGKANPAFQAYLDACYEGRPCDKPPHASAGARYAYRIMKSIGVPDACPEVVLPILGHHVGLNSLGKLGELHGQEILREAVQVANTLPPGTRPPQSLQGTARDLRIRMIYSALVDADYLDTEQHFDPNKSSARGEWTRPKDLWKIFRADQLRMMWKGRGESPLNRLRRQIYRECVRQAKLKPGVFRLTVPTGGGKTRSGLAFALRHATEHPAHGFRRIIVALPYTSIIDQTASEYRGIFGNRLVLEHHSQLDPPDDEDQGEEQVRLRLASENWDHPLIITTTVQLFESLFHNKAARCRKLHNLANSILILDEIQTLPPELLSPTLDVLRDLFDNYGVTLVLSSATQPSYDDSPYVKAFDGQDFKQIVRQPEKFFTHTAMKRVEYQPVRWTQDLDDLADELCADAANQSLVVFNTRRAAIEMHDRLRQRNADGLFHLSSQLCGKHRKRLLKEIWRRLDRNNPQPVRLVSTQVIEAGVDLDFPIVYRALGPLDRIVQVAGRCNREGKRPNLGKVIIFDFEGNRAPPGSYRIGMDDSETLLRRNEPERLHDPAMHTEYFNYLFRDAELDKKEVQPYRRDLNFPEVARRYRLIEPTVLIVVSDYDNGEGENRLQTHLNAPSRESYRRLIPYTVNLRHDELRRGEVAQCVEEVREGLYRWTGDYDDKTHRGLCGVVREPADLIVSEE